MAVNLKTQIPTAAILQEMLTENTGHALCDSGGDPKFDKAGNYLGSEHGYGRSCERNQGRKFDSESPTILRFDADHGGEIQVTHNVYFWLKNRVDFAADWDRIFHYEFVPEVDPGNDKCWLELMEEFGDWLSNRGSEVAGLYGDSEPFTSNTYNGEDLLSQVLQYTYFEVDNESFILLQIHGGCDVRGGYTKPRAFKTDDQIFMNADGVICCSENREHNWSTDDAYHWYYDGCIAGKQLEQYKFMTIDDWKENNNNIDPFEMPFVNPNQLKLGFHGSVEVIDRPTYKAYGIVLVDDDFNGYCPVCNGILRAI